MGNEIILKYSNPFCISLYFVSLVTVVLDITGLYSMYKSYKKFCFEQYVLFSGLFELCLIVFHIFLPDDILLNLIQTIQILQPLYITQKFMVIYVHLSYKDKENNANTQIEIENKITKYNYYIKIVSIALVLLIISFVLIEIFDPFEDAIDDYLFYSHDALCLIICIILFVFSMKIQKLINSKLNEKNTENDPQNIIDETYRKITEENEYYLITRKKQIFLISICYLIINGLECIISAIELTITLIFNPKNYGTRPKKRIWEKVLDIYEFTTDYACLINTICNYFTFYFIIRKSIKLEYKPHRKSQVLKIEDINNNSISLIDQSKATDAENYLNED